jgi:hypothetical protein
VEVKMKGINSEELLNKRVKIKAYSNNEYVGIVTGYVPAQDNEPEVEEISILNEKDNKNYSLFENEVRNIEILK